MDRFYTADDDDMKSAEKHDEARRSRAMKAMNLAELAGPISVERQREKSFPASRSLAREAPARALAVLSLSTEQRTELRALALNSQLNARHMRRIRVVLLSSEGIPGVEIARRLELSVGQVSRIRQRFLRQGVTGLADSPHLGRHDHAIPEQALVLIAELAASPPPPGRKRWSSRLIAARVGLSSATVAKVLRKARSQLAPTPISAGAGERA